MGKSSPKAPAAPDPAKTAAAQTASDKETARYNAQLQNMNQYTPYGSLTYKETPVTPNYDEVAYQKAMDSYKKTGKWTNINGYSVDKSPEVFRSTFDLNKGNAPKWESTITLSPEQQQLYNTQTQSENALASLGAAQLGRIGESVSTPFSYEGLGDAPTAQSVEQLSQQGQDALMARLNPQFGYDEEALRTRLINQGIGQNSEAYNREMDRFNQAKNDARTQAVLQGANYGGTLQNQALARRNQGIQEYTTQRNAPLNEYTAMTSGTQIQNPSFSSGGNEGINPVDYTSLINQQYQGQLGAYNSKVASNNATQSSLFSLGGTALGMFSDRRAKTNIVKTGEKNGFNIYQFSYKEGISDTLDPSKTYEGVMADEIKQIMPEAVMTGEDGYDRVNYSMIGIEMKEVA